MVTEQNNSDDRDLKLKTKIDAELEWLPESDRAYAAFFNEGFESKAACREDGVKSSSLRGNLRSGYRLRFAEGMANCDALQRRFGSHFSV
jgi:hypothetical protein